MTPEDRSGISRRNGALSQGPVTDEGKRRSALNSVTHGCCSNAPADEGERSELNRQVEALMAEYKPATVEAADCLKVCAAVTMRRARAAIVAAEADRATEAVARQRAADALRAHADEEERAVQEHAEGLRKDPEAALKALGAMAAGCEWIAGRFARLASKLDNRGRLAPALAGEAVRLMGARPGAGLIDSPAAWTVRLLCLLVSGTAKPEAIERLFEPDRMPRRLRGEYDPNNLPDRDEAMRRLLALFGAERDKWAAEAERLRPARQAAREGAKAEAMLAVDTSVLGLARRYERRAERDLHRAWAAFHAAMARAAAAPNEPETASPVAPNEPGTGDTDGAVEAAPEMIYGDPGPSPGSRPAVVGTDGRVSRRTFAGVETGERASAA